jgi:hypothetical protein
MRFDLTIENAIYDWVKMIHPSTLVIWDKQDANRPTTDYILLNIITAGNMEAKSKLSNNPITHLNCIDHPSFQSVLLPLLFSQMTHKYLSSVLGEHTNFLF